MLKTLRFPSRCVILSAAIPKKASQTDRSREHKQLNPFAGLILKMIS